MTPCYEDGQATIYLGDALDVLRALPDGAVQMCVTSPPYWGLRDYGVDGQLGLERTPEEYVVNMVDVFREVRRVLRDDGTIWVNLGDTYSSGGRETQVRDTFRDAASGKQKHLNGTAVRAATPENCKPKDLVGIPWMVAFALRADGWYLRSDIIWAKPNPMPESVTDRPTKAHEYLFLLSKSARYYYDADAIREAGSLNVPWAASSHGGLLDVSRNDQGSSTLGKPARATDKQRGHSRPHEGFNSKWDAMTKEEQAADGRNKRTVWTIATQPYPEAHFATYPEALVEPCILAGSPEGGTVLDPFLGSGTSLAVAKRLGRRGVGIELNPEYIELAKRRCSQMGMIMEVAQ